MYASIRTNFSFDLTEQQNSFECCFYTMDIITLIATPCTQHLSINVKKHGYLIAYPFILFIIWKQTEFNDLWQIYEGQGLDR